MTAAAGEIKTEGELKKAITECFKVLREVDGGDLSAQIQIGYAETEPMRVLAESVNAVIQRLSSMRQEIEAHVREIDDQVATIEKQRAAIKELSTPMIEVWAGVLCVPVVGVIDSSRAAEMTSALLAAVVEKKVRFTIIDITGIEAMDTRATDHFLRMARSVRLLGAECVLSGINPNVARSIIHMGVELTGIETYRSLRNALQRYVRRQLTPHGKNGAGETNGHAETHDKSGEKK